MGTSPEFVGSIVELVLLLSVVGAAALKNDRQYINHMIYAIHGTI